MYALAASVGGDRPGAGAEGGLHLLDEMRSLIGLRPDAACFTTVTVAFSSTSQLGAVLNAMATDGVVPDAAACTILVGVYACRLHWFDAAYEVMRWMAKSGVVPDIVTYLTLISRLCSARWMAEALGMLDLMLEEGCQPNAHMYTPILHAYCKCGMIHAAKHLLETMIAASAPSTAIYNVPVEALCKVCVFKEVDALLEESSAKGWTPDSITYNAYMDGLCKDGRVDKSLALVDKMLSVGLRPNEITLNILLDGVCRRSTAWAAKCLLQCSAEIGWHVNVVIYNTVMRRLCDERRWLAVIKLFVDMVKKGITPNSLTSNILIHSLCKLGKLHEALCLLGSEEFVADVVTYNTLIHRLKFLWKDYEAYLLLHEMIEKDFAPNDITYNLLIDCLCKEGKFLVALSRLNQCMEGGLSKAAVSSILRGLIAGGKLRELQALIGWILGQGLVIDVYMYQELIISFCKKGYCGGLEMI